MLARLLTIALTLATGADAGVIYHFSTKFVGRRYEFKQSGRVWADGNRYRFEVDGDAKLEGRPFDVAISTDADKTAKYLNTGKQTWYERRRVGTATRSSMLFDLPVSGGKLGRRRVNHVENGLETIAGKPARKHIIEIEYEIGAKFSDGRVMEGKVEAKVLIWTAESLPQPPLQRPLKTGYPDIDAELARLSSKMKGMVLRHDLTVTRTVGGEKATEHVLTIVNDVSVSDIDPSKFEVPPGFRHERP
jgi:hypothetical protein